MFDFPNAPTTGQTVQGGAGQFYAWDGAKWVGQTPPGPLPISQGGTGVNNAAAAPWVELVGDTMTGQLILQATNPTDNNAATRKLYVDNAVSNALAIANMKVALAGDTMSGPLYVNLNAAAPTVQSGVPLQVIGADGANNSVHVASYGSTAVQSYVTLRRARGTAAAPTAVQSSDGIGQFNVHGYTGSAWAFGGGMNWVTRENWTATANGTYISLQTINPGTLTMRESVLIGQGLVVGSTLTNDPGPGGIYATGAVGAAGLNIVAASGDANITLRKPASGTSCGIYGFAIDGVKGRWLIALGDSTAESGSNSGSNFAIYSYNDAGGYIGNPLFINRATGLVSIYSALVSGSPGYGQAALYPGNSSNSGYVSITAPNGTRIGYMGYSTSGLTIVADAGFTIMLSGNSTQPGATNAYWCGLPAGSGNYWYGVAAASFPVQSDERLKTQIGDLPDDCLDLVQAVTPKRYQLRDPPDDEVGAVFWGFLGQDVDSAMQTAGHDFSGALRIRDGWHSLDYGQMNAVLWKAVQELTARLEALEAR